MAFVKFNYNLKTGEEGLPLITHINDREISGVTSVKGKLGWIAITVTGNYSFIPFAPPFPPDYQDDFILRVSDGNQVCITITPNGNDVDINIFYWSNDQWIHQDDSQLYLYLTNEIV